MNIAQVEVLPDFRLRVVLGDGASGFFDVRPYMQFEAFGPLDNPEEFSKLRDGGYYVEWDCGADLSADTIEARLQRASVS